MEKALYTTGVLGVFAALMVGMGEFLIHFNPAGLDLGIPYGYFHGIDPGRLNQGHFIMVPFIPLYVFGYWHLHLAIKPGHPRLAIAIFGLGVFAFVIGGIWVGSRAYFGHVIQLTAADEYGNLREELIANYRNLVETLVEILRVLIILISGIFVFAILKGGTMYPTWMAFFNPFGLLLVIFALFFFARPLGQYLAPTAMNVAHAILFSASLLSLQNTKPEKQRSPS